MKLLPFLRKLGGIAALCCSLSVLDSAPAASAGDSALYAVGGLSSNDIWAAGYKYQGSLSFPLVEHWDGASWSIVPNPTNGIQSQMHGVAMIAPNDVWIVGQTWNVSDLAYVLHWDGTSLQSVPCVNPGSSLRYMPSPRWPRMTSGRPAIIRPTATTTSRSSNTGTAPAGVLCPAPVDLRLAHRDHGGGRK